MAKSTLPRGLSSHYGKIRIKIGRGPGLPPYRETLDLSPANQRDVATAVKYKDAIKSRLQLGLSPHAEEMKGRLAPFSAEMCEKYLHFLRSGQRKEETLDGYERMLRRIWLPVLEGKPLCEITRLEIKNRLADMDCGPKGKTNALNPLRGFFKHYEIDPNPANIPNDTFGFQDKEEVDRYNNTERSALIHHATGRLQVMLAILFSMGLRPGEMLGLQVDDFDPNKNIWWVRRQVKVRTGIDHKLKTRVSRRVYMDPWANDYVLPHMERADSWLFLNTEGGVVRHRTPIYDEFKALHEKAGVKILQPGYLERNMYTCRHTRASELLSIGVSTGEAAAQLGHTPEMFERIYARFIDEFTGKTDKTHLSGPGLVARQPDSAAVVLSLVDSGKLKVVR